QMDSKVVSVIMPTLCAPARRSVLQRSVESICFQGEVVKEIIVVINGSSADTQTIRWLSSQPLVRIHYLQEASLPAAIRHGRSLVTATYFAFLDDDDTYLPAALQRRLDEMERTAADVVATNGFMENGESAFPRGPLVNASPLLALADFNWLPSCGG